MAGGDQVPIAVVARPPDGDNLLQFDTFRGGADLKIGTATLDPVSSLPRLLGRSYPTHTPVARVGVKPMNHALE